MSTVYRASCDCTWQGQYRSRARAEFSLRQHSCQRAAARAAAARRRSEPREPAVAKPSVLDQARAGAFGPWDGLITASPVRAYALTLNAAGLRWTQIAALAGLPPSDLGRLVVGDRTASGARAPLRRVSRGTAVALLTVKRPGRGVSPVDGTGTRRRIEALAARGWSLGLVADLAHVARPVLMHTLAGEPVTVRCAAKVRVVFELLWDRTPDATTPRERDAVARTLRQARSAGWAPPMAWDDDTINDPEAKPAHDLADSESSGSLDEMTVAAVLSGSRTGQLTREERLEVLVDLAGRGMSDSAIGERLNVTARTVLRDRQLLGVASQWTIAS